MLLNRLPQYVSVSSELRRCVDRGLDNYTEISYYQLEVGIAGLINLRSEYVKLMFRAPALHFALTRSSPPRKLAVAVDLPQFPNLG